MALELFGMSENIYLIDIFYSIFHNCDSDIIRFYISSSIYNYATVISLLQKTFFSLNLNGKEKDSYSFFSIFEITLILHTISMFNPFKSIYSFMNKP